MNLPTMRASSRVRRAAGEKESGQSVVELAFVVTLTMAMMLGVFDLGRGFYAYMSVVHAAREGARAAMSCSNDSGAVSAAASSATSLTVSVSVTLAACAPDLRREGPSTVTVTHVHDWLTTRGAFWGGGASLTMTSTMTSR